MTRAIHRPYAKHRGGPPSVTTVLGLLDKPGLSWAAARETALFAVNHQSQWEDLEPDAAVDKLYRFHRGVWDQSAALGTALHSVNEAWVNGEEVDLEQIVVDVQAKGKVWAQMPTATVVDQLGRMVDGLEAFWDFYKPDTISVEDVVRFSKPERQTYIGQSDWRVRINGHAWLLDLKTTSHDDPTKALYFSDWRLQLCAYKYCQEIVDYDDDANETGTRALPRVERCGIVHIRAGGGWQLIPVAAGQTEHNIFLRLRDIYGWLKSDGTEPGYDAYVPTSLPETVSA